MEKEMTFIYTPKSGCRLFSSKDTNFVGRVTYINSSHHVMGGVKLEFPAAAQGRAYWRPAAKQMADMLVTTYGGVAWDHQGTICMVVPRRAAKQAIAAMEAARCSYTSYDPDGVRIDGAADLQNHLACGLVGWELLPTGGGMCSLDMLVPMTFSLGEFRGKEEEIGQGKKDLTCTKQGDKFAYSLGGYQWTSPWEVEGCDVWEVPVMEEAPAPVERAAVRAPLIVD